MLLILLALFGVFVTTDTPARPRAARAFTADTDPDRLITIADAVALTGVSRTQV